MHSTLSQKVSHTDFFAFSSSTYLPVLYGENAENALRHLLAEIISQSGDILVSHWVGEASSCHHSCQYHLVPNNTLPNVGPGECSHTRNSATTLLRVHVNCIVHLLTYLSRGLSTVGFYYPALFTELQMSS